MSRWICRVALSLALLTAAAPVWADGDSRGGEPGWLGRLVIWVEAGWEAIEGSAPAVRAETPAPSAPEKAGWEWDPWGLLERLLSGQGGG